MKESQLLIEVRFHRGQYHGHPDWPPSPARLFQALLAGASKGSETPQESLESLKWLENLPPPLIHAPRASRGKETTNYVPNNGLTSPEKGKKPQVTDAISQSIAASGKQYVRTRKVIQPWLFDQQQPLYYAWTFTSGVDYALTICSLAKRLYQLGRGVDMAYASGEILDTEALGSLLTKNGVTYRPTREGIGTDLLSPSPGSLKSLLRCFEADRNKFSKKVYTKSPRKHFVKVAYDAPPKRVLFDLIDPSNNRYSHPLKLIARLAEDIRDRAVMRLKQALSGQEVQIERFIRGLQSSNVDKRDRIQIIPLPSIGSLYTNPSIRRVLIEVPQSCPIIADDIEWAFDDLAFCDELSGEQLFTLVRSDKKAMCQHYGIENCSKGHLSWKTVTPVILPMPRKSSPVSGASRMAAEVCQLNAFYRALYHAGIHSEIVHVKIQREPFTRQGLLARDFVTPNRLQDRLAAHVTVTFRQRRRGPLLIGDGRYLGLGLMAPMEVSRSDRDVALFVIPKEMRPPSEDRQDFLHAIRRALMSLAREPNWEVPPLFSGHEREGGAARSGQHHHIFLAAYDSTSGGLLDHLIIAAPWICDRTVETLAKNQQLFHRVVSRLREVRAGRLGVINPIALDGSALPQVLGTGRIWVSSSDYQMTRHVKRGKNLEEALLADVMRECRRRGLPAPAITILNHTMDQEGQISAQLRLQFKIVVAGPILIGRNSHMGGGLFTLENDG